MRQNTFDSKNYPDKMLNEQIIEFELRGPGPPSGTCIPKPGYFHDKNKILPSKYSSDYLLLKILQEAMYHALSTWAKLLTKFNPPFQDFKRVLDLICK